MLASETLGKTEKLKVISLLLFTGMPYAFRLAGVGLGTFLLVFIAIITDYSLILMVKGGELSGTTSYQVI
jgi:hypothetical protein